MSKHDWLATLARDCTGKTNILGQFMAKVALRVDLSSDQVMSKHEAMGHLLKEMAYMGLDSTRKVPTDLEATLAALQSLGANKLETLKFDESKMAHLFGNGIEKLFDTLASYPQLFELIEHHSFIEDALGLVAKRYLNLFKLIPSFSSQAVSVLPQLREPCFSALYDLNEKEFSELSGLTMLILKSIYKEKIRPEIAKAYEEDLRAKHLLLPLVDYVVEILPPSRCVGALLSMMCTPKAELTQGRIISIVLQEMGGLFVKLSQVLAEISPPTLAKELKAQQDNAGGLFGSDEKSWKYVLDIFERPELARWKKLIHIQKETKKYFASASVGAIYQFELTEEGKRELNFEGKVLLKVQRPGLTHLFQEQKETLLDILVKMEATIQGSPLPKESQQELFGLISALKRSIINYASQSLLELDFRIEKQNADNVRNALKEKYTLQVPEYFEVHPDLALMQRVMGEKITHVVRSRYLERKGIADLVARAYLDLLFEHGIIWADPHAGNILYDAEHLEVKLIDLNPCFAWDQSTIRQFVIFLYRLILSDEKGLFESLRTLLEKPQDLDIEKNSAAIKKFIQNGNQGAFIRYLTDFVRILGECNLDLKTEIQAALRGLSQIYLTSNSISSRNSFGQLLQERLGWKTLLATVWEIGIFRVIKTAIPIVFDVLKNTPEEEVGPTLDERDLTALEKIATDLTHQNVCNIELSRTSPEENTRLVLSSDGSRLMRSSHLRVMIMEETKPATVKYIIEIPTKEWLKERQEYIKLIGLGFSFCIVECLEQLRRHSLEDYWQVVECWNDPQSELSITEMQLMGEVRLAARKLFARRFKNIWGSNFLPVSFYYRYLWRILIWLEERFELKEQGSLYLFFKRFGNITGGDLTLGTMHRAKIILYRGIIFGFKMLIKTARFELNLLPLSTKDLSRRMVYGLHRGDQNEH